MKFIKGTIIGKSILVPLDVITAPAKRERVCTQWASFGLYIFLSTFFWASGTAPLRSIFYLFLFIPFFLVLSWRQFRLEEYGGYHTVAAVIFAAYSLLTCLWGNPSDFSVYFRSSFFLTFWLAGVSWLFYHRPINTQKLYSFIACVGCVCSLGTLYLFYIHKGNLLTTRMNGFGLIENPTIVAQVFGVSSLLAYMRSVYIVNWKLSSAFFCIALVCALPLVFSQSRGASLALLSGISIAIFLVKPKPNIWISQVIIVSIVIAMICSMSNIAEALYNRGISLSLRDVIWIELYKQIPDHLFFGAGLEAGTRIFIENIGTFHHAHNSWVAILYHTGLVGLLLALLHAALLFRGFTRNKNILPVYLWLVYGCICLFSNGSFLLSRLDVQWFMYWVPAGLLVALIRSKTQC